MEDRIDAHENPACVVDTHHQGCKKLVGILPDVVDASVSCAVFDLEPMFV
jgi:hypothetical protein